MFLLLFALLLFAPVCSHADYLVDFLVNYQKIGEYLVYEREGELYAEQALFRRVGIPAQEDLPLKTLENVGRVHFDRARQRLDLLNPDLFRKKTTPAVSEYKPAYGERFFVRSIDFQGGYIFNSKSKPDWNVVVNQRVLTFDSDLYLNRDRQSIHFERVSDHPLVRQFSFGYIPRYGYTGVLISNENEQRFGDFLTDEVWVVYPLGTRIEVYRQEIFLREYIVDAQPFRVELPLDYGTNVFQIKAYTPSGEVQERSITKDVSSSLLRKGEFQYLLSAGRLQGKNEVDYNVHASYGLTKNVSLFSSLSKRTQYVSSYISIGNNGYLQPVLYNDGYGLQSYLFMKSTDVFLSIQEREKYRNWSFRLAPRVWGYPSISWQRNRFSERTTMRSYLHFSRVSLSPYVSFVEEDGAGRYRQFGLSSSLFLRNLRLSAAYEAQTGVSENQRLQLSLSYTGRYGDYTVRANLKRDKHLLTHMGLDTSELNLNICRWGYAAVQVRASYNHLSSEKTLYLGVVFSFDVVSRRFSRDSLHYRSPLVVRPFLDENGNGKLDPTEKLVESTVVVDGVKYESRGSPTVVHVTPRIPHTVTVDGDIDVAPSVSPAVRVIPLSRSEPTYVDIPFTEVTELEGCLPEKDRGTRVHLLVDGETYATTYTRFGCYVFRIPASLTKKVTVVVE